MFHLLTVLFLVLACLPEHEAGGKVAGRRRERQAKGVVQGQAKGVVRQVKGVVQGVRQARGAVQGRQGSGSKVMPAARAAAKAAGEGSTTVRGKSVGGRGGGRGGGGRKQKRGGRGRGQQQGREGRALGGEKSGVKGKSRRQGGGGGRRGGKKIRPSDLPDLKALPGTAFDCDEKNPRLPFFIKFGIFAFTCLST